MKRISRIGICNYKAYINTATITLPQGENLLVYGENGSGKSSLYHALRLFLRSSVDTDCSFERNDYMPTNPGYVCLDYGDYDATTMSIDEATVTSYRLSTIANETNNAVDFIQTCYRTSGFLDYTQLLKVYLIEKDRPNLFHLVFDLIGSYIATRYGGTYPLRNELHNIIIALHKAYHRTDSQFINAHIQLNTFRAELEHVIDDLNTELQALISHYFSGMNMSVRLTKPIIGYVDNRRLQDIDLPGEIYLDIDHYGIAMPNYNRKLNEARLSAIAVCLYLASLKFYPTQAEAKLLFLDDVFLGLDLGNRKPILDIIQHEFSAYQVIISTYDKSWYNQAKDILEQAGHWRFYEFYEGTHTLPNQQIVSRPIILEGQSFFCKACQYLNDNDRLDYSASANYLRKAFEKLLQNKFYEDAIRDENAELIPIYQLSHLVSACLSFSGQIVDYVSDISDLSVSLTELQGILHPLLHPLSHFSPGVPTYKSELQHAVSLYERLENILERAVFSRHCRVLLGKQSVIKLIVRGTSGWVYEYELQLQGRAYLYDNNQGARSISHFSFRAIHQQATKGGLITYSQAITKNSRIGKAMQYVSLDDCYAKIKSQIEDEGRNDIVAHPIDEMFYVVDENGAQMVMRDFVANFQW